MFADGNQAYGEFGRNFFTPLVHILNRTVKVASQPIMVTRKLTQGNIKGAVNSALDMVNPAVSVAKIATDNPRLLNYARLTSPTSVVNITDRDMRKKAAVGYAAAAIIAGGVFIATAGAGVAAATAAEGAVLGPTAATLAAAGGGGLTLAQVGAGLATAAKVGSTFINKDREGPGAEGQERAGAPGSEQRYETELKDTPWLMYGGVTLGVITIGSLIYYFAKSKEV